MMLVFLSSQRTMTPLIHSQADAGLRHVPCLVGTRRGAPRPCVSCFRRLEHGVIDRTGPYFFKFQILPCGIRVIIDITVCQWALRPLASTSYVISPFYLGLRREESKKLISTVSRLFGEWEDKASLTSALLWRCAHTD
jgi:hypothetical protein